MGYIFRTFSPHCSQSTIMTLYTEPMFCLFSIMDVLSGTPSLRYKSPVWESLNHEYGYYMSTKVVKLLFLLEIKLNFEALYQKIWIFSKAPHTLWPHQLLQQPHKHSHSLQLAAHTELAHHYIEYALWTFKSKRIFLKYCAGHWE